MCAANRTMQPKSSQLDNNSGFPSKYQKHHKINTYQTNQRTAVDIQVLRRIAKRYYLILLVAILFVCITLQNVRSYNYYTSLFIIETTSINDTLTILPRVDEVEKRILVNNINTHI